MSEYLPLAYATIPSIALYAMFAVAWHRRYLIPEERPTVWSALRWDARKTRFLLRLIITSVLGLLVVSVPLLAAGLAATGSLVALTSGDFPLLDMVYTSFAGLIVGLIFLYLIYGRLFLCLPAAAIDDPADLKEIWRLGRHNTWQLFWIAMMVGAPFAGVSSMWSGWVEMASALGMTASLIVIFGEQALTYAGIAIGVSALSICYRRLKDAPQPVPAEQPAEPV